MAPTLILWRPGFGRVLGEFRLDDSFFLEELLFFFYQLRGIYHVILYDTLPGVALASQPPLTRYFHIYAERKLRSGDITTRTKSRHPTEERSRAHGKTGDTRKHSQHDSSAAGK